MNRRRFLAFLGALGPGMALARAGMGAGSTPVVITTPWISVADMLKQYYVPELLTRPRRSRRRGRERW